MRMADALSLSRIIIALMLPLLAYLHQTILLLILFSIGLLTDVLDGAIARSQKKSSRKGHDLDIIADNILAACFMLGLFILKPGIMLSYWKEIAFVISIALAAHAISLVLKKRLLLEKTNIGMMTAILFPIAFISAFFFGTGIIMYAYLILMIYSNVMKFFDHVIHADKLRYLVLAAAYLGFFLIATLPRSVCFETACIDAEVMDTNEARMVGLMYRSNLGEDKGMLFVFEQSERYGFWMKNVNFPIDMIFLDRDKAIIYIANATPCVEEPCAVYTPELPALYVIEVNAGFSEMNGIGVGQKVSLP